MSSEEEKKKKAIFESMSPKRQKRILEKGYEQWDPFRMPKEPPFFSEEDRRARRQIADLVDRFLDHAARRILKAPPSPAYIQSVRDIAFGLARGEERYQAMYDYSVWFAAIAKGADAG
ncbi:MAG: hypothetical protein AB1640_14540 [bacterium]